MRNAINISAETKALDKLRGLIGCEDKDGAHMMADDTLCDLLIELGYNEVVSAYKQVEKWYA